MWCLWVGSGSVADQIEPEERPRKRQCCCSSWLAMLRGMSTNSFSCPHAILSFCLSVCLSLLPHGARHVACVAVDSVVPSHFAPINFPHFNPRTSASLLAIVATVFSLHALCVVCVCLVLHVRYASLGSGEGVAHCRK